MKAGELTELIMKETWISQANVGDQTNQVMW
jgi:hypothetical protein